MYRVTATKLDNPSSQVIGLASVTIDDKFRLDSIRVIKSEKAEKGFFLAMPSYQTNRRDANDKPIYKNLFYSPDKEFTTALTNAVADAMKMDTAVEIFKERTEDLSVKVVPTNNEETNIKADVTVFVKPANSDAKTTMVIDSIKLRKSMSGENAGKNFVALPSRSTKDGTYRNICYPITKESRENLFSDIFTKYNKAINKEASEEKAGFRVSDARESDVMLK